MEKVQDQLVAEEDELATVRALLFNLVEASDTPISPMSRRFRWAFKEAEEYLRKVVGE